MTTTTNYGYTVITGSDSPVNIQNDIAPNFTAIDGDLKDVSDAAITVAIHTVAGSVHQLVRDDADRNVLYFVATGDMVAGDTFTVDGVSVTVRLVNGETLATGSFKINNNVFGILVGTVLNLFVPGATATASGTTYDNTGSGLTATDVQDAIDEVNSDLEALAENVETKVTGIITAGATTITLSNAKIHTTSFIDVYFWDVVLAPTGVTVAEGSVTITIPAQATNTNVAVRVANI